MVGVTRSDDILYEPEWAFFLTVVAILLLLIFASVIVVSYFYNKTWLQEYWRGPFKYQKVQGTALKNDDVNDPEALVSINADNSAFDFLHEAKNVMSSDDIFKRKLVENSEEAEAERLRAERRRKRRGQQVDLEEVEGLKERLEKHMVEMKKLFGESVDDDEDLDEDEAKQAQADRLFARITKLRELITDNRKMIEGIEEDKAGLDFQRNDEAAEKRRREAEEASRKQAEQDLRDRQTKQRDQNDLNADVTKMKQARNKVIARNDDAMTQARRELEARLEGLPEDERNRILEEFDRNQEHLDGMLKEDEAR